MFLSLMSKKLLESVGASQAVIPPTAIILKVPPYWGWLVAAVVEVDVDVVTTVEEEDVVWGVVWVVVEQPLKISPAKMITAKITKMTFFTAISTPF